MSRSPYAYISELENTAHAIERFLDGLHADAFEFVRSFDGPSIERAARALRNELEAVLHAAEDAVRNDYDEHRIGTFEALGRR